MAKYLMAIDAGTGSVRAVLFDWKETSWDVPSRSGSTLRTPDIPAAWTSIGT